MAPVSKLRNDQLPDLLRLETSGLQCVDMFVCVEEVGITGERIRMIVTMSHLVML